MGKVIYDISMSLDGFISGANARPEAGWAGLGDTGTRCYCNVEMIELDDKTIRLEERKPGQFPAPATEDNREPPVSRDRHDTFSYNHGAAIKTF